MTLPSTSTREWTVVHRRGRNRDRQRQKQPLPTAPPPPVHLPAISPLPSPAPWAPSDPSPPSPSSVSDLLLRIRSSTRALSSSSFLRRFLSRLPQRLHSLPPSLPLVVYGLGSPSSFETPRLQLSLALLLHAHLRLLPPLQIFDPVLSTVECAALSALGCHVLPFDESGSRRVDGPTLFYMPHCDAALYDNLLRANWSRESLNNIAVLGNSFCGYADHVDLAGRGSVVGRDACYVLLASALAEEVRIDGGLEEEDQGGPLFAAFHSTSWHLFDLDRELEDVSCCSVEERRGVAAASSSVGIN